jgi:hypothetical protein
MLTIIIVLLLLLSVLILVFWQRAKWSQYKLQLRETVLQNDGAPLQRVNLAEVDSLPPPVKRYFQHVLKNQQPIVKKVTLHQQGGFRVNPNIPTWSNMKAVQYFSTCPRAFLWDARIDVAPRVPAHFAINVCDSYIDGKGGMRAKMLSLANILDAQDKPQLDSGALQRYLAESVWFPTALLPSQGVSWEAIDADRAKASITNAGVSVSLEFQFNAQAEVAIVFTSGRYREVNGEYELTGWQGRFSDYVEMGGYLVPSRAEVEWHLKDQPYPYWKAHIEEIQYES